MTSLMRLRLLPTVVTLGLTALVVSSCTPPPSEPVTDMPAEAIVDDTASGEDLDGTDVEEEDVWPKIVVLRDEPYAVDEDCEDGPFSLCDLTEDQYIEMLVASRDRLSKQFGNVPYEFSQEDWAFTFTVFPEHQALALAYFDEQIDDLVDVFYEPGTTFETIAPLVEGFDFSADRTELTVTLVNAAAYTPNLLGFGLDGAGSMGGSLENWMIQHQLWQGLPSQERSLTVTYVDGQTGNVLAVEDIS